MVHAKILTEFKTCIQNLLLDSFHSEKCEGILLISLSNKSAKELEGKQNV